MLSVTLTSIGLVGLALVCWPSSRLRVLSLRGAGFTLRLALWAIIATAFTATIWPGWGDEYVATDGPATMIDTMLTSIAPLPVSAKALSLCAAIVGLTLPVVSMIDLARQAAVAMNLLARETAIRPRPTDEKPSTAPIAPVGRRELQAALDAMTRAATNGTTSPPAKKRTLAEIVK